MVLERVGRSPIGRLGRIIVDKFPRRASVLDASSARVEIAETGFVTLKRGTRVTPRVGYGGISYVFLPTIALRSDTTVGLKHQQQDSNYATFVLDSDLRERIRSKLTVAMKAVSEAGNNGRRDTKAELQTGLLNLALGQVDEDLAQGFVADEELPLEGHDPKSVKSVELEVRATGVISARSLA